MSKDINSGKKKKSIPFQLLIVVMLLAVVGGSFGLNVLGLGKQHSAPKQLGNLKLVSSVEGEQALTEVNSLHAADIGLTSAFVARYALGQEQVTVWVGTAESSAGALSLMDRMLAGIAKGGTGFSNPVKLIIPDGYHNHEVYQVQGPGGNQFLYISKQAKEKVVWVTVETDDDTSILGQAIKAF
jgi:hypothetical protein